MWPKRSCASGLRQDLDYYGTLVTRVIWFQEECLSNELSLHFICNDYNSYFQENKKKRNKKKKGTVKEYRQ